MEIRVKSKSRIERRNRTKKPHVIISIYTPELPRANPVTNALTREVLFLGFDDLIDIKYFPYMGRYSNLFKPEQAQSVVDLLERNPDVQRVIVQCEMGVSRSASIAASLSKVYNGSADPFLDTSKYRINPHVYNTMMHALELSHSGK